MRIRKNAKLSAFLQPNAAPFSHTHETNLLCELNQSPWDIITFPSTHSSPSIHQFDDFDIHYNVNLAANWSSLDSVGSIQRFKIDLDDSVASTKNSFECKDDNVNENVEDMMKDYKLYEKEDDFGFIEEDEMVLCGKTNGKKGWQCGKRVKNGNFMCDDNLIDHKNNAIRATNKKAQPVSRSSRPKKRAGAVASNKNEFYYYSGFGPSWGKKRGELRNECKDFNAYDSVIITTITTSSNINESSGISGVEEEHKNVRPHIDTATVRTSWPCQVGPKKEDLDYVGEEQDNQKEKEKTVKKRGRKPIKARSLKSLM